MVAPVLVLAAALALAAPVHVAVDAMAGVVVVEQYKKYIIKRIKKLFEII